MSVPRGTCSEYGDEVYRVEYPYSGRVRVIGNNRAVAERFADSEAGLLRTPVRVWAMRAAMVVYVAEVRS